tara:strand:+ start:59358 stop:59828 length:471 start_codon:yes stop_codon:yes gene_type:complete
MVTIKKTIPTKKIGFLASLRLRFLTNKEKKLDNQIKKIEMYELYIKESIIRYIKFDYLMRNAKEQIEISDMSCQRHMQTIMFNSFSASHSILVKKYAITQNIFLWKKIFKETMVLRYEKIVKDLKVTITEENIPYDLSELDELINVLKKKFRYKLS